jgi:hypothetical protein
MNADTDAKERPLFVATPEAQGEGDIDAGPPADPPTALEVQAADEAGEVLAQEMDAEEPQLDEQAGVRSAVAGEQPAGEEPPAEIDAGPAPDGPPEE